MKAVQNYEFLVTGQRKYDFDKCQPGQVYRYIQGEDFTCSLRSFQSTVRAFARRRGLEFVTNQDRHNPKAIVIRFTKPSANPPTRTKRSPKRKTKTVGAKSCP